MQFCIIISDMFKCSKKSLSLLYYEILISVRLSSNPKQGIPAPPIWPECSTMLQLFGILFRKAQVEFIMLETWCSHHYCTPANFFLSHVKSITQHRKNSYLNDVLSYRSSYRINTPKEMKDHYHESWESGLVKTISHYYWAPEISFIFPIAKQTVTYFSSIVPTKIILKTCFPHFSGTVPIQKCILR